MIVSIGSKFIFGAATTRIWTEHLALNMRIHLEYSCSRSTEVEHETVRSHLPYLRTRPIQPSLARAGQSPHRENIIEARIDHLRKTMKAKAGGEWKANGTSDTHFPAGVKRERTSF